MQPDFHQLIAKAQLAGASDARIIPSTAIIVEEQLADICKEPRCQNYGLSPSCPPHVEGPQGFMNLIKETSHALAIRIDVPSDVLFSNERREVMRLLHEIVAGIEKQAVAMGYSHSRGFAGGSCKNLFCNDHIECRVLSGQGKCRNPGDARQSMSGFGVNVGKMMQAAGWEDKKISSTKGHPEDHTSWVAGVVMIG